MCAAFLKNYQKKHLGKSWSISFLTLLTMLIAIAQPLQAAEVGFSVTVQKESCSAGHPAIEGTAVSGAGSFTDPTTGMEFLPVPAGCFQMGDIFGDGAANEKPVHEVCVKGFSIGKYEVTQGQWKKIMGNNPSSFSGCGDDCPVENVSWNDAQKFIQRLNRQSGRNYRLPTEAEWEYAARSGGRREKYSGGDNIEALGWYIGNSRSTTHPVGRKQPNALGVFDMSGNVWEYVSDVYNDYYGNSPRNNPQGPLSRLDHVLRGGSWYDGQRGVRVSDRGNFALGLHGGYLGFRLVFYPDIGVTLRFPNGQAEMPPSINLTFLNPLPSRIR